MCKGPSVCGAALWKRCSPHFPPGPRGAPAAPPPRAPSAPHCWGTFVKPPAVHPALPPAPPDQHGAARGERGPRLGREEGTWGGASGAKLPAESVWHRWPAPWDRSGHSPGVPLRRAASVARAPTASALPALGPAPPQPTPGASSMNQHTPVEGSLIALFTDPRRRGQPGQRRGASPPRPGRGAGHRRAGARQGLCLGGLCRALLPASSDFALSRGPGLLAAANGKQVGLELQAVRGQTLAEPPLQPVAGPVLASVLTQAAGRAVGPARPPKSPTHLPSSIHPSGSDSPVPGPAGPGGPCAEAASMVRRASSASRDTPAPSGDTMALPPPFL